MVKIALDPVMYHAPLDDAGGRPGRFFIAMQHAAGVVSHLVGSGAARTMGPPPHRAHDQALAQRARGLAGSRAAQRHHRTGDSAKSGGGVGSGRRRS
jgi:hypothetical protein